MLTSIEGNFNNPEVHKLLIKHFIELRAASPEGSAHVLDIDGLVKKTHQHMADSWNYKAEPCIIFYFLNLYCDQSFFCL